MASNGETPADGTERLRVRNVVNHENNCAACGVYDPVDDFRHCANCRDALVRTSGDTEQMFE